MNTKLDDWIPGYAKGSTGSSIGVFVLVGAFCALLAFGILGIGRGGTEGFADVRYWYISARLWLDGQNPYDYEVFRGFSRSHGLGEIFTFPYPPQIFVLGVLIAAFPFAIAKLAWTFLNLAAVVVLAYWGARLVRIRAVAIGVAPSRIADWLIPAIIIGNPFTAHVVWTGQTSLIVAASLITGWQLVHGGSFLLGGLLLAVATIKPQLSILIVLWLILNRHWRALATGGIGVLAFSAVPMSVVGPSATLLGWVDSLKAYQVEVASGLSYNLNLKSLLNGLGFGLPPSSMLVFMLCAIGMTLVLWRLQNRRKLDQQDVLALLLGSSLLLTSGRDYDLVVLVPALSAMWWHVRGDRLSQLVSTALMVALFVPHRVMEKFGLPFLLYWRIVILLFLVGWLFSCSLEKRDNAMTR